MSDSRILLIKNPKAGTASQADKLGELFAARGNCEVRETQKPGDAEEMAAEAVIEGVDMVVAAGGDGTINEVIQGLMAVDGRTRLGILPLGTGNDLARMLSIPTDPIAAFELLDRGEARRLDLIEVESNGSKRYCINVAAGGFSGQVDELLTEELKARWGPLAYVRGAVAALPSLTGYATTIAWDDQDFEAIEAFNIIVANGRTCAGGIRVAPSADPEDGLLDVVVVRHGSLLDLATIGAMLITGNYIDSPDVFHRRARRVRIAAKPGMWFNIDGELFTKDPISFAVRPSALSIVVGDDYLAERRSTEPKAA